MRYHSSLPPRLHAPKLPQDPTVQRSRPTCKLSLANASACTSSVDAVHATDPEVMEVDLPTPHTPPSTTQQSVENGAVPFPASPREQSSRKHSLLRSTVPRLEIFPSSDASAVQSSRGPPSPTEQTPPRKRTRTSALSSPSRPRPHRLASLPSRPPHPSPSSTSLTPLSPSLLVSDRQMAPAKSGIAPVTSSFLPFSPILPAPNVVSYLLASVSEEPAHSTRFRRRKPAASEMRVLVSVYRTIVYGLEMRYPRGRRFAEIGEAHGSPSCPSLSVRSRFDTQDALLAHHLKPYLLVNGASRDSILVDVDQMARERVGSMDMDVDSDVEATPQPLHPRSPSDFAILSYQQLVSGLILRHRSMHPRRSQGRKGKNNRDQARKASALAESHTLDL